MTALVIAEHDNISLGSITSRHSHQLRHNVTAVVLGMHHLDITYFGDFRFAQPPCLGTQQSVGVSRIRFDPHPTLDAIGTRDVTYRHQIGGDGYT